VNDLIGKLIRLHESIIDYPMAGLDLSVWNDDGSGDAYTLRGDVKRKIISTLGLYTDADLVDIAAKNEDGEPEIHIVGSMCTNQYTEDTDIDVHIVVPEDSEFFEDPLFQEQVHNWFKEEENLSYIGKHPIEVYIQFNPNQELLSDGVYAIFSDEWVKGPKIVPQDYDPYDDFTDLFDDIRSLVKDVDLGLGELKRDIIDYETVQLAIQKIPANKRGDLHGRLNQKLHEIESDIKDLYKKRRELTKSREISSQPRTPEEALKSVEIAKEWRDKNAIFKFVGRYKYLRVIKELEQLIDGGIEDQDVPDIKKVVDP